MRKSKYVSTVFFALALSVVPASASLSVYIGEDLNAGPGAPHPSSSAMAAVFDTAAAAIGNVSLINFESAPLGAFTTLTVAPGVTISGANLSGDPQHIYNTPDFPAAPALGGFNTTPGGSQYADLLGGSLTFTFATPTQFFGGYFTGIQTAFFQDVLEFSDGTSETVDFPGAGTSSSAGALDFVGFTDPGKSISSVTVFAGSTGGADAIGVDDVRYESAATPEPGYKAFMLIGLFSMILGARRYRIARG